MQPSLGTGSQLQGREDGSVKLLKRVLACGATLAALSAPAHAQNNADQVSSVSLIAEASEVHPGQTILIGLRFELEDHWHIYWDGRNDTGFAPMIDWDLPDGVRVGPLLWPAPSRYVSPGNILDHVYEGTPTILTMLTVDPDVAPGTSLEIKGQVEWLVCNDVCLPGFGPVSLELTTAPKVLSSPEQLEPLSPDAPIGRSASKLPVPLTAQTKPAGLSLRWGEDIVTVEYQDATSLAFYPMLASVSLVSTLEDAKAEGSKLALRLAAPEDDLSSSDERRLVGVLAATTDEGAVWYLIDFGSDGLRQPADAELISHVRARVERRPS